jgi:hypothetical protein
MSTALAIAGVTAVLQSLLNDGFIENDVSGLVGGNVDVSAEAPDSILTNGSLDQPRLNIYFYQATPNTGWRNASLPSRNNTGQRLTNQPLALDLHYLLTAYGTADLQAEILLGFAMQVLHEIPVFARGQIDAIFSGLGGNVPIALQQALQQSGLADQVEQIKITPEYLNSEEMSKLWTAVQSNYRPTAAYQATVVLIEAEQPGITALPVLTRGPRVEVEGLGEREQGIIAQPGLVPILPTITAIEPPLQQSSARLGDVITIRGHDLDGTDLSVRFVHHRLDDPLEVSPEPGASAAQLSAQIPNAPGDWVAGFYRVSVQVEQPFAGQPGEIVLRTSNEMPLVLAPTIDLPPDAVNRDAVSEDVTVTITCSPQVQPFQSVSLILGQHEAPAEAHENQTAQLTFIFHDLAAGDYPVRLRIDGAESWLIDLTTTPPAFDPSQTITVPP